MLPIANVGKLLNVLLLKLYVKFVALKVGPLAALVESVYGSGKNK